LPPEATNCARGADGAVDEVGKGLPTGDAPLTTTGGVDCLSLGIGDVEGLGDERPLGYNDACQKLGWDRLVNKMG
jgi:hypothetical protein